jgi:Flp pilus assembly protein TadG
MNFLSSIKSGIKRSIGRFAKDTSGSLVAEAMFIVPVMAMGMSGFYAFWDAYQTQNRVQKGAYAISDMLSREMVPATPAFLNGLETTLEYLIGTDARTRITSIRRNSGGPTGATGLTVLWSHSPGATMPPLTNATLNQVISEVPMMAVGSNVVVYEVVVPYSPVTEILTLNTINEVVAMRPRFLPTLCLTGVTC